MIFHSVLLIFSIASHCGKTDNFPTVPNIGNTQGTGNISKVYKVIQDRSQSIDRTQNEAHNEGTIPKKKQNRNMYTNPDLINQPVKIANER